MSSASAPASPSPSGPQVPAQAQFRFRMRVVSGGDIPIGPGKIELLQAVEQHRSISAAAKSLGMSYRRAWLLIDEMNRSLREPVVKTETGGVQGGGTALTDFGCQLVSLYQEIEATAHQACQADIQRMLAMVAAR